MWIKVFRCACGFKVRAMFAQGCAAVFRPDPEAWQELCAYSNLIDLPKDCPRLLEVIDPYGQAKKMSRKPAKLRLRAAGAA